MRVLVVTWNESQTVSVGQRISHFLPSDVTIYLNLVETALAEELLGDGPCKPNLVSHSLSEHKWNGSLKEMRNCGLEKLWQLASDELDKQIADHNRAEEDDR